MKTFTARTASQWHTWLDTHHATESEVWLVIYKAHTGQRTIAMSDAVDGALCFGWIDSLVKRLDEDRYAVKFTPRKANSKWSAINRRRYARLKASGRLQPAGIMRAPGSRTAIPPSRFVMPSALPPYIQTALKKEPAARQSFENLSPGHQRTYVGWIDSAKRDDTKARRLAEAIRLLRAGKPLGLK